MERFCLQGRNQYQQVGRMTFSTRNHVYYFTDGSVRRDKGLGCGGWLRTSDDGIDDYGFEIILDSNSALSEIIGIKNALKDMHRLRTKEEYKESEFFLISDNQYCINALNEWLYVWMEEKRKIKFREHWEEIHILVKDLSFFPFWVKGHDGNHYNETIDDICREALKHC